MTEKTDLIDKAHRGSMKAQGVLIGFLTAELREALQKQGVTNQHLKDKDVVITNQRFMLDKNERFFNALKAQPEWDNLRDKVNALLDASHSPTVKDPSSD